MRSALQLDLAGLGALKSALPAPIFSGTLGESGCLCKVLGKVGITKSMAEDS